MSLSEFPRTFLENPADVVAVACRGAVATLERSTVCLAGQAQPVTAAEAKDLIERSRAGEHIELEFEATTYLQSDDTSNRNFVRFKKSALSAIAKTGNGSVFLRDHAQWTQAQRGGTILKSKLVREGDVAKFSQLIRVTTPWAVQGVLDGTIDRFSIGWYPTGPLVYSHNGEEIEGWPKWWPGQELEDGTIVEWVYTAAELVETSAVNVPAVIGTEIGDEIRAALAAGSNSNRPRGPEQKQQGDSTMLTRIKAILGLSEAASDEDALKALEAVKARGDGLQAKLELAEAKLLDDKVDRDVQEAISDGRLKLCRDDGGQVVPSKTEAALRRIADKLGYDAFREQLDELEAKPTPVTSASTKRAYNREPGADPAESDSGASAHSESAQRENLEADETIKAYAEATGRSIEDVLKSAKRNPVLAARMARA